MTSATARMETPALIPTSDSAEKGKERKIVEAGVEASKDEEKSSQPKTLAAATSVAPRASGTSEIDGKVSSASAKSRPSSRMNDLDPPPYSEVVDVIDSALLAALRDPRERLGLLKLEQNLIDFLEKQPQDSYVDIGGPYNSTVISPTLGYIGQQPQQLQAMAQPQPDGTNAGRPQTTFQRCILHRICDRFNMTRENSYTTDVYGCYLIRVCKGPDSKKPPRRLLNVKESEYQISRPSPDVTNGSGSSNSSHQLASNFQQMNIAPTSSTTIPAGIAGVGATSTKGSAKVRKMKIMKRSSSNVSNSSSGSNNGRAKNNVTSAKARSTLSEKEKKYAEARARIFEQEEGSSSVSGDQPAAVSSQTNNHYGSGSTDFAVTSNITTGIQGNAGNNRNYGNPEIHNELSHSERRGTYNNGNGNNPSRPPMQSYPTPSPATGPTTHDTNSPPHNNSTTSLNSMASNNSGKGSTSDTDQQQTGTRSKATYRNRQQEETDPDFRRGAGIQLQTNPYAHAHTAVGYGIVGGGRGAGNIYYPNNMMASNSNKTNNRVGYGFTQQQQQLYQYQQQYHPQQHYSAQHHHQAQYYATNNPVGGRGFAHSSIQYQQQRRQQEQHFPALSSSTTRK